MKVGILSIVFLLLNLIGGRSAFPAQSAAGVWSSSFPLPPGANGEIYAMATIGSNLYVGGVFTEIAGVRARGLAKFDGSVWTEFGGVSDAQYSSSQVRAIVGQGTNIYVAGNFTKIGGIAATNIARWNGARWEPLAEGVRTIATNSYFFEAVQSLYAQGTNLYVGGQFNKAGAVDVTNIARWDGAQWHSLGAGVSVPPPTRPTQGTSTLGEVRAMTGDGTNIYVGGMFMFAGNVAVTNLARWDGSTWHAMAGLDSGATGYLVDDKVIYDNVRTLLWRDNALYVGGGFNRVGDFPATSLAKWNGQSWEAPFVFEFISVPFVNALLPLANDQLLIAGQFTSANGQPATNAVVWKGESWTPLNLEYYSWFGSPVLAAQLGERLFIGGAISAPDFVSFLNIGEATDHGLQQIDSGRGNHPWVSKAITADGTNIFIAGDYAGLGTNAPLAIAKLTGTNWSIAAPAFDPGVTIAHLAVIGSNIYAGGAFSEPQLGFTNLAVWNSQQWKPVGPIVGRPLFVDSMIALGSTLYLGGSAFGENGNSVKKFNGTNWSVVPWITPAASKHSFAVEGTNLFIARSLHNSGGMRMTRVARWDGRTVFEFPGEMPIAYVSALGVNGTNIWVAGSKIGPYEAANTLYRWTGTSWFEWQILGAEYDHIVSITPLGDGMAVCGQFRSIGGVVANSIAYWDGAAWHPLHDGLKMGEWPGDAKMISANNNLYAIGTFDTAGQYSSGNFAIWHSPTVVELTAQNDDFADRLSLDGLAFEIQASAFGATLEANDPTRAELVEYINREIHSAVYSTNLASTWCTWTAPITGYAFLSVVEYPGAVEDYRPLFVVYRGEALEELTADTRVGALSVWPGLYASVPIIAGETYSLAFVNDALTNATYTIRLEASTTPVILQHPESQTIRAGGACAFTVLAPGCMTGGNIQWQHNGEDIPGANGPTLLVHNATLASAGEYRALVNIQNPSAITTSSPAMLTVEGQDLAPQLKIGRGEDFFGVWKIQVIGEPNQHYLFQVSTNLTSEFAPLLPSEFIPHNGVVSLETDESPLALVRAVRAGDLAQLCIANQLRVDFAKEAWRVIYAQPNGAPINVTEVDLFLDGMMLECPLGGDFNYAGIGAQPSCSYPGHAR